MGLSTKWVNKKRCVSVGKLLVQLLQSSKADNFATEKIIMKGILERFLPLTDIIYQQRESNNTPMAS